MSVTRVRTKTSAWIKFLHQWLVAGTDGGYKEYRRILEEEHGLEMLIYEWKVFIIYQYFYGWISQDQCYKYMDSLPKKLKQLVYMRNIRGEPSRVPKGCKLFVKGNKLQLIGHANTARKKELLKQQEEEQNK